MMYAIKTTRGPTMNRSNLSKALLAALAAVALGGCKHDGQGTQVAGWSLVDPEQRHPIMVSQQPAHLNLHVARGSQGLSPQERADVIEFAGRYRASDAGNSRLVVSVPSGGGNETSAMTAADEVRGLLLEGGFPESAISIEAYHDESGAPPLRISYMRYIAEGPDCGNNWSENLASDTKNVGHPNFGCANQRNLAAMVVNPADLLGPRTMGERYSDRRDKVMDNWVKGKSTGAEKSEEEKVRVKGTE